MEMDSFHCFTFSLRRDCVWCSLGCSVRILILVCMCVCAFFFFFFGFWCGFCKGGWICFDRELLDSWRFLVALWEVELECVFEMFGFFFIMAGYL